MWLPFRNKQEPEQEPEEEWPRFPPKLEIPPDAYISGALSDERLSLLYNELTLGGGDMD